MIKRRDGTDPIELVERDQVVSDALRRFDPATEDPTYWFRFHRRVMASVRRELAGRRMLADLTMSEIMAGWARTVVPTALMVAATAALLLFRSPEINLEPTVLKSILPRVFVFWGRFFFASESHRTPPFPQKIPNRSQISKNSCCFGSQK